jgi:hypothetical protein
VFRSSTTPRGAWTIHRSARLLRDIARQGQDDAHRLVPEIGVEALNQDDNNTGPARDEAFFAGAGLTDDELQHAARDDRQRKQQAKHRHAEATRRNLGLGHDLRAGLMATTGQLQAWKAIVRHALAEHYRDVIAYGAGWSDQERQQPVGDTGRHEPRHPDTILDAELQHALEDPDPPRGIAQLSARWAAALRPGPRRRHPHQDPRHRAH